MHPLGTYPLVYEGSYRGGVGAVEKGNVFMALELAPSTA
jgi:hypothetical protein